MASVSKRVREENGRTTTTWLARWRDLEGVQRKRSFRRKSEADRFLRGVAADLDRGSYVDPTDRTTVSEYAWRWAASRPHGTGSAVRTASQIRTHVDGTWLGGRRLAAVLPSEAQSWATDRSRVLAPSTLRGLVKLVRSIYASAVLDKLVTASPFVRLSLPKVPHDKVVPLTVDQVGGLADVIGYRYYAMVLTQAGLGLRVGELLGLRLRDIDFLGRTVRVEHQPAATGSARQLVPLKTDGSPRTLFLPTMVAEALAEHLRRFPAEPASTGCSCCPDDEPSGLLFHTRTNRPYGRERYGTRVFGHAVEAVALGPARRAAVASELAAGRARAEVARAHRVDSATVALLAAAGPLGDVVVPGDTTPHDLRHHFASVLLAAGESVVAVAEVLGHDDASLVLSTYGHLMPNSEDRMRRAVDAAWCPAGLDDAASAPGVPRAITGVR